MDARVIPSTIKKLGVHLHSASLAEERMGHAIVSFIRPFVISTATNKDMRYVL